MSGRWAGHCSDFIAVAVLARVQPRPRSCQKGVALGVEWVAVSASTTTPSMVAPVHLRSKF
eukprot:1856361-Amphidinium_carterae.1